MRKILVASTCLTPLALLSALSPAHAATVTIGAAQTTPVSTSTANAGQPADVSISSSGSIAPSAGAAVTIDSSNSVTNAGTITFTGIDNAIGIAADAGVAGSIVNSGTITVSENYTQTDTNGDGVVDGPFAEGSNRFGISTAGALTGDITSSGTITIQGNDSAGIALGGTLTGNLSQTGTITVRGDNSSGITTGAVTGDVGIAGTVSATGSGASAVILGGNIGGTLTVQGTLTSTGYTSTTLPASTASLGADNLLQGGPTLQVAGSVAGGIVLTAATSTTDSTGATVTTTAAAITSFGSGAAVQIGSASNAISIGALASDTNGYGLEVNGAVSGLGVYDGVTAHGMTIGGIGGTVAIAGGAVVNGTISATSNDASATALEIGSGASVPVVAVAGTVSATGAASAGNVSTALLVDAGASVPTITNSGTLSATAENTSADATAVADRSGSVTQFTNTGTVTATGGAANVALDFSAGSQNVTVTQEAASGSTTTPSIVGDILFGAGNDTLAVSAGTVTGNVQFGSGADTLALSGSGVFTGNADFDNASGGNLSVGTGSTFTGTLSQAGGTAISVSGGTLSLTSTGSVSVASLAVSNGGTLGIEVDGTTGAATQYQVAGTASFAAGSTIALHFNDITHVVGDYTVVQAGSLTGSANVSVASSTLPYLFTATVGTNSTGNALDIDVAQKTAGQLGLNRAESAAYAPTIAAISGDKPLGDSFLTYTNASSLTRALRTMLPDFAGGSFDTVSLASRTSARWLADPAAPVIDAGPWGVWIQQNGWLDSKSVGNSAGYKVSGLGISAGGEYALGNLGRFGLSFGYMSGTNDDKGTANSVTDNQYELGAYWRANWGGLHAFARGSIASVNFTSRRTFVGSDGTAVVNRVANGSWNGKMVSGMGGLSYQLNIGAFSLRPQVSVDYYRLREDGYTETGGGVGMDLSVDGRTSNELAANEQLAVGYRIFEDPDSQDGYIRIELEGGRREVLSGSLGATTASFAGGDQFTLIPDARTGGWTGAVRLKGGNDSFAVSGEVDGEREQSATAVGLRAGVQIGF
jgi:uncharacterized protein with beta-barrel porin domain